MESKAEEYEIRTLKELWRYLKPLFLNGFFVIGVYCFSSFVIDFSLLLGFRNVANVLGVALCFEMAVFLPIMLIVLRNEIKH